MCRQGAQDYVNCVKHVKWIKRSLMMSKTWIGYGYRIEPDEVIKYCPECGEVYDDPSSSAFRKGLCHICNTELKEEEVK